MLFQDLTVFTKAPFPKEETEPIGIPILEIRELFIT
jgi:hypothetical protein